MSGSAEQSSVPSVPHWDDIRTTTDILLEHQTIAHFLECAISGTLPGGGKSNTPKISTDVYMNYLAQPYINWAPQSYHHLGEAPMERIMGRIGSYEFSDHIVATERMTDTLKSRLWEGIAPMTNHRWMCKGLHMEGRVEDAIETIQGVLGVFGYLRNPEVQGHMRDIYNLIHTEMKYFQEAVNPILSQANEPEINIVGFWEEFITKSFNVMTYQARSWMFEHILEQRDIYDGRALQTLMSGRVISASHATVKIDHRAIAISSLLLDLSLEVDFSASIPINDFNGLDPGTQTTSVPLSPDEMTKKYIEDITAKRAAFETKLQAEVDRLKAEQNADGLVPDFMESLSLVRARAFAHQAINPEVGPWDTILPKKTENWVNTILKNDHGEVAPKPFGFVAYMIFYDNLDENWGHFKATLMSQMDAWSGVEGGEQLKKLATLQWIDGRTVGIPENDIEATRQHFATFREGSDIKDGMHTTICLAFDASTILSFNINNQNNPIARGSLPIDACTGDWRPFVLAIDADFTPPETPQTPPAAPHSSPLIEFTIPTAESCKPPFPPADYNSDSPFYQGCMRILDQLVWTDLYAMLASQCQFLDQLWPLAIEHPWNVYCGPTTAMQRKIWGEIRDGRLAILQKVAVDMQNPLLRVARGGREGPNGCAPQ